MPGAGAMDWQFNIDGYRMLRNNDAHPKNMSKLESEDRYWPKPIGVTTKSSKPVLTSGNIIIASYLW